MIEYTDSAAEIAEDALSGFFEGWPNAPTAATHLRLLRSSDHVVLAGVLSFYIPFLEVLPAYRRGGIGTRLVEMLIDRLRQLYMVDVTCDPNVQPFYERLGMKATSGMILRHYDRQSGH
jgi:ribosomal protein S18 acetylase RimI-like enzyme